MLRRRLARKAALLLTLAALGSAAPGAAAQQAGGPSAVAARGFNFAPRSLTVPAGTTVTWTNEDPVDHTVTADDRSFDSGLFGQGRTFSFTFTTPGTYAYYCTPHGGPGGAGMSGTIVVTAAAAGAAPPAQPAQPGRAGLPIAEVGSALVASGALAGAAGLALRRRRPQA